MTEPNYAYLRTEDAPVLPPPPSRVGFRGWLWENMFASMANFSSTQAAAQSIGMIVLTIAIAYFALSQIWSFVDFALISAVWPGAEGVKRLSCATEAQGGALPNDWFGACYTYAAANWKLFVYGRYPDEALWRVNLVYAVGAVGLAWVMIERAPARKWVGLAMLLAFPVFALILLTGGRFELAAETWAVWVALAALFLGIGYAAQRGLLGEIGDALGGAAFTIGGVLAGAALLVWPATVDFGLMEVETALWGGLLVTLVVAITGIVASLPIGVLLALGRRSSLPAVRILSIVFIEFWRGVPLITVLFMSSVMLPLFLPEGVEMDKLLRALIGVMLFSSAYMAEVVRGGLQAIPKGQYEGAQAMGLSYWRMMGLIILPQALVLVIPGIVNTFIGLFKDTTLVLIIGLFDLLGQVQQTFSDSEWSVPVQAPTGYLIAGAIFWAFCFGMSRYSMFMERKLRRGHAR